MFLLVFVFKVIFTSFHDLNSSYQLLSQSFNHLEGMPGPPSREGIEPTASDRTVEVGEARSFDRSSEVMPRQILPRHSISDRSGILGGAPPV